MTFQSVFSDVCAVVYRWMDIRLAVGQRLKMLRQARALSQSQLAEKIDRSVHAISMLERGKTWPSADMIIAIAKALAVDPSQLLDGIAVQLETNEREKLVASGEASLRAMTDGNLKAAVIMLAALRGF